MVAARAPQRCMLPLLLLLLPSTSAAAEADDLLSSCMWLSLSPRRRVAEGSCWCCVVREEGEWKREQGWY